MREPQAEPRIMPLLVTPTEAARMLGIGLRTLQDLYAKGEIPAIRLGKSVRIKVSEIEKWVEKQGGK